MHLAALLKVGAKQTFGKQEPHSKARLATFYGLTSNLRRSARRTYTSAVIPAIFTIVFIFRAVPCSAPRMRSLDVPMPLG